MRATLAGLAAIGLLLSGCNKPSDVSLAGPKSQGRYAGIGVFDAGRLWAEMMVSGSTTDPAMARIVDDEHVIVVLDTHTGEVRECGDHSGYCVAMDPWAGSPTRLPAKLMKHASDLVAKDQAEVEKPTARK